MIYCPLGAWSLWARRARWNKATEITMMVPLAALGTQVEFPFICTEVTAGYGLARELVWRNTHPYPSRHQSGSDVQGPNLISETAPELWSIANDRTFLNPAFPAVATTFSTIRIGNRLSIKHTIGHLVSVFLNCVSKTSERTGHAYVINLVKDAFCPGGGREQQPPRG